MDDCGVITRKERLCKNKVVAFIFKSYNVFFIHVAIQKTLQLYITLFTNLTKSSTVNEGINLLAASTVRLITNPL